MGKQRVFSPHVRWGEPELSLMRVHYADAAWSDLLGMLPGRSRSQIQNKANALGLQRRRPPKMTDEERLKRKREGMARRRAADPEAARAYSRANHEANLTTRTQKMREYSRRRFFWTKAMKLRGEDRATHRQIAALWRFQKGRCALTGRKLDRAAQLDHKTPKARDGGDEIQNLQWLCPEANLSKRDLTDGEFTALCEDVMRWIGERINRIKSI